MRNVIYGLGENFDKWTVSDDFSLDDVVALVDKSSSLIGKNMFGYTVIAPNDILGVNFDKILISSYKYYDEIQKELISLGIDKGKIELLTYKSAKENAELLYWKKVYKAENGNFANDHYKKIFLGIANEKNDLFLKNKVVVDFGCGPRGSLVWTDTPRIKIGCDVLVNKYFSEFGTCLKNHGMIYVNTDEKNIPLPTEFVDVLSTINSLDHVADLDSIISEFLRIMKAGALFIGSFNLNEPCTVEEPQTLTLGLLEEKLFKWFEIIDKRIAIKEEHNTYINITSGNFVSKLEPNEVGVLWVKARKK